jgi:signal transduction histidine kinase
MSAHSVSTFSGRSAHFAVLALTVVVFGAAVAVITLQLRAGIREQILRREAGWLEAVASMQLAEGAGNLGGEPIEKVPGALLVAVLKTEKLAGVSGVRVFDSTRRLSNAWGVMAAEESAPAALWDRLTATGAIGRLHRRGPPEEEAEVFLLAPSATMLEAWVPLRLNRSGALLGAAQFWRDGTDLADELAAHDRRVWIQAGIAWLAGSLVIATALGWALRRVNDANRKLRGRSEDLQRANRELVLAAKTSALGAVTAHLMHELKNPLAGLEVIVAGQSEAGTRSEFGPGGELAAASELTRRLRTMVNDVVGVLRDEQTSAEFELTCADIAEIVVAKVQAEAVERGIGLQVFADPVVSIAGRRANLATLVLRNLIQNALEATPRGGTVTLKGRGIDDGGMEFLVEDGGGGLPEAVKARLFQPCASTKMGGSGLGLALSYQLAQQAGGRLELVRSDGGGACFGLVLRPEA